MRVCSHGFSGLPLTTLGPQHLLLLGSGTGMKGAQISFLPAALRPCPGASPFPVNRTISPAMLSS